MDDKRHAQRKRVLKAGTISFQGSGFDCVVRNMSIGGVPDSFDVLIGAENGKHHCRVVWQKKKPIGVAFD